MQCQILRWPLKPTKPDWSVVYNRPKGSKAAVPNPPTVSAQPYSWSWLQHCIRNHLLSPRLPKSSRVRADGRKTRSHDWSACIVLVCCRFIGAILSRTQDRSPISNGIFMEMRAEVGAALRQSSGPFCHLVTELSWSSAGPGREQWS